MDKNAEEWLATEDPTEGDLPTTEFTGSAKDLSQTVAPEETDGTGIEDAPVRNAPGIEDAPVRNAPGEEEVTA